MNIRVSRQYPCGESKLKGEFPEEVKAHLQYGYTFTAVSEIMSYAMMECPPPDNAGPKKQGKKKKGKERSLIERLVKFKDSVCLFIHDFAVPFDNNQAERDLRNVKT